MEKENKDSIVGDYTGISHKRKVYYMFYGDQPVLPILTGEEKISVIVTVNKGPRKFFMQW